MNEFWISLQSVPPAGQTRVYDNQATWEACFVDFGIPCRIVEPVSASIFVLTQETGVLFKGAVKGTLALPCDRCTEDSIVALDEEFATFEGYPETGAPQNKKGAPVKNAPSDSDEEDGLDLDIDEEVIRPAQRGNGIEINPMAYAWQELALALPVKPLCRESCKGLCPVCGKNLNNSACACDKNQGDPRLALLRKVKISKPGNQ